MIQDDDNLDDDDDTTDDDESPGFAGRLFSLAFISALPVSPGMFALSLVRYGTGVNLDVGQMWTFSILANIAIVFGLRATVTAGDDFPESLRGAVSLSKRFSFATLAIALVCHFGLKWHLLGLFLWWFGLPGLLPFSR